MIKVQQKISGPFAVPLGPTAFCAFAATSRTMRKQGRSMLASLVAVFEGSRFPLPGNLAPE